MTESAPSPLPPVPVSADVVVIGGGQIDLPSPASTSMHRDRGSPLRETPGPDRSRRGPKAVEQGGLSLQCGRSIDRSGCRASSSQTRAGGPLKGAIALGQRSRRREREKQRRQRRARRALDTHARIARPCVGRRVAREGVAHRESLVRSRWGSIKGTGAVRMGSVGL